MTPENTQQDSLTGVMNRQSFDERLHDVVARAEAQEFPFSLAFLDLDEFLQINETYGRAAGDALLVSLARILESNAGKDALIARYGGDEFVVLLMNTEREQAFLTMERVRSAVHEIKSLRVGEQTIPVQVTVSVGVASFPIDARSGTELLRKADQALYRSKQMGRNQVRLAYEERMLPKTSHYTQTQLERLSRLAEREGVGEAVLLREALDNLLMKYNVTRFDE